MHGDPDNLESLHNKREYEHYRKATPEYIDQLLKTVERARSDYSYEFGKWTAERLAIYLTQKTGIDLSSSQLRRILKRKKSPRHSPGFYIQATTRGELHLGAESPGREFCPANPRS